LWNLSRRIDIFDPTDMALKFRGIFLSELNKAARAT
jgi:hypothetical protein